MPKDNVTRKSAKDYALAPKYYVKDFDPRTVDPTSLPKHEEFVKIIKGPVTPVRQLVNQFMLPIPVEAGMI